MAQHVTPAERKAAEKAHDLTEQAIEAFESHKPDRAARLAQKAVSAGPDVVDATRLVELFRVTGEAEASAALTEATLGRLETLATAETEDGDALAQFGHLCMELHRPDLAEPILMRAHELGQSDGRAELLLLHILLGRDEPERLLKIWERFLNETVEQARFVILLAKALAHFGYRDHALRVMATAEPLFARERDVYEETLANIRGAEGGMDQSEVAARIFDEAAEGYDKNLKAIGNAGPAMIARMLRELDFRESAGLEVLDAGCGTGLCAPYLRPYAARIHGCDVSIKMLELCKEKQLYDLLTRTDLGTRATFPDGPFDLVVSGDVLVYFGDLLGVMKNIADVLKPGGWFLFTFEDAGEEAPAAGHLLRSSGRHAHSLGYVSDTLARAGFTRPKAEFADVLRREFRSPVHGRAVAAQKLAIFGAMG